MLGRGLHGAEVDDRFDPLKAGVVIVHKVEDGLATSRVAFVWREYAHIT